MSRAARTPRLAAVLPTLLAAAALAACARAPEPPAPRCAVGTCDWSPVTRYLDSAVASGAAPGAVLGVSIAGERFVYGTGRLGLADSTRPGPRTVYDLASLTKVVGLTTAAMMAVDEGRLDLDAPVQRYVPEFAGPERARVTIRHLLTHSSGLPAWRPLYREAATRAEALALADTTPLEAEPGTRFTYSDLGAIVLTQALERLYGTRLDTLLERRLFRPLRLRDTRYLPPPAWLPRIAPTENDPWRGRILRGEVHDENAARLDGVSGHAGLFASAADLLTFGEWLLGERDTASAAGRAGVTRPGVAPMFFRRQALPPGSSRALGWDTPSEGSSGGTRLSAHAFGHTGFTGTSIWIDPDRRLVIVLLSNRVHPTRENNRWGPVRGRVADLVVGTLASAPAEAPAGAPAEPRPGTE
ncbi:MAG TPA: serine hydrolase domain-containing protein [Gemmatimonadales bacterium]|nr:serine hydrolase domain-containing protein [Gemmatimonadales bacterium]